MPDAALPVPRPAHQIAGPDAGGAVAAFLSGRNARTLAAYGRDLEDFRAFLVGAGLPAPTIDAAAAVLLGGGLGSANATALAYRAHLLGRGLAPATINRRLAAVRSLVKLARSLGLVAWALETPGVASEAYRDTRGPGVDGVRALVAALDAGAACGERKALRDRAAVRLLYDLGLRRTEVLELDVAHVDLAGAAVQVRGKGRSERVRLTLPPKTRDAVAAWLAERGPAPGPLFVNFDPARKGGRLTGRSLARIVGALGAGVGLVVRPHGLRHAAITEVLDRSNGNVRAAQRFSRHRSLAVLERYDDNRADLAGEMAALVAAGV